MKRIAIAIGIILFLPYAYVAANTLRVPSQYATIQSAIIASGTGDSILVADGIYSAAGGTVINAKSNLTLISENGKDATILKYGGEPDVLSIRSSYDIKVVGFTVRDGGAALIAINSSSLIKVLDCRACYSSQYGIWIDDSSQDVFISNCVIEVTSIGIAAHGSNINVSNTTIRNNLNGIECFWSGNLSGTFESNVITNNTTGIMFRAPGGPSSSVIIDGNMINGNGSHGIEVWDWQALGISNNMVAGNGSCGIYVNSGSPDINHNTIIENSTYGIYIASGNSNLNHNLICVNKGAGVAAGFASNPIIACNDVWGNSNFANGNYVGFISDQTGYNGNISVDPVFCHPNTDDFSLASNSPALTASCGPMGAVAIPGCSNQTAAQQITWGAIKSLYK